MASYRFTRIRNAADALAETHGTRDPFIIAAEEGIEVVYRPFEELKGFYTRLAGQSFIVLNSGLAADERKLICAHELGHDQLHRDLAEDRIFREFMLYDLRRQPEYEANLFAAALLLQDEEVLGNLEDGETLYELAARLRVEPQLLRLKLRLMDFPEEGLPGYDDRFLQYRTQPQV